MTTEISRNMNVSFDELMANKPNETLISFDQIFDVAGSIETAQSMLDKSGMTVHQALADQAIALYLEADKDDSRFASQSEAMEYFLAKCTEAETSYKIRAGTTTTPRTVTQAKADIKRAWTIEGADLNTLRTTNNMRKFATEHKKAKEQEELLRGQALVAQEKANTVSGVNVPAGDATTKTSEAKATIKAEGIDPDSPLGIELKAYLDAIVNAHNNQGGKGDAELCEALSAARGKLGKTVMHIANKLSGENQAA